MAILSSVVQQPVQFEVQLSLVTAMVFDLDCPGAVEGLAPKELQMLL